MIYKYEIISPVIDRKKPHVDKTGAFIVPDIKYPYRYYVEVRRYNNSIFSYEYFVLLSTIKFDNNCRKCIVDNYGRLKVRLCREIKDFVNNEIAVRGNVDFEYIESEDIYDVFQIV